MWLPPNVLLCKIQGETGDTHFNWMGMDDLVKIEEKNGCGSSVAVVLHEL